MNSEIKQRRKVRSRKAAQLLNEVQQVGQDRGEAAQEVRMQTPAEQSQQGNASEQITLVKAHIDVGLGNALFIRGQGNGLSWAQGQPLACVDPAQWVWSGKQPEGRTVFKLLLNDQVWSQGEDLVVEVGRTVEVTPHF